MIPAAIRALRRDCPAAAARVVEWETRRLNTYGEGYAAIGYDVDNRQVARVDVFIPPTGGWRATVRSVSA